ncbi:unnamed protein product [Rotaria sordida]|uniref:Uncharacterized protein n=1 Tax=Rotaria sordida TaxID=392033 RepID=A0A814YN29_9BILA|nr:unnamed protein product [Rotaria sordida]
MYFNKQGGTVWNHRSNISVDNSKKYKREVLKGDLSSTSHLVESAESSTSQSPPVPRRPSSMASSHSSYRQTSVNISLSYQQASAFPNSYPPPTSLRSYSPDQDDDDGDDENDVSIKAMPLTANRSRTNTPFGSHKSLSDSIQSLRSNQQPALSLPVKKHSHEPSPLPALMIQKPDQRTQTPKPFHIIVLNIVIVVPLMGNKLDKIEPGTGRKICPDQFGDANKIGLAYYVLYHAPSDITSDEVGKYSHHGLAIDINGSQTNL